MERVDEHPPTLLMFEPFLSTFFITLWVFFTGFITHFLSPAFIFSDAAGFPHSTEPDSPERRWRFLLTPPPWTDSHHVPFILRMGHCRAEQRNTVWCDKRRLKSHDMQPRWLQPLFRFNIWFKMKRRKHADKVRGGVRKRDSQFVSQSVSTEGGEMSGSTVCWVSLYGIFWLIDLLKTHLRRTEENGSS